MKTSRVLAVIAILAFFSLNLYSEPRITILDNDAEIPHHVTYNKTTKQNNDKAIETLKKLCSPKEFNISEVPKTIMTGPRLWNAVKDIKEISSKPSINAKIHGTLYGKKMVLDAGVIKSEQRTYALLATFKKIILKSKKAVIRKASKNELTYYWMIISYDIDEPLYILELDDFKFLIDFVNNAKIFYIEDITGLSRE